MDDGLSLIDNRKFIRRLYKAFNDDQGLHIHSYLLGTTQYPAGAAVLVDKVIIYGAKYAPNSVIVGSASVDFTFNNGVVCSY